MSDKIPHKHKLVIDKIITFLYIDSGKRKIGMFLVGRSFSYNKTKNNQRLIDMN